MRYQTAEDSVTLETFSFEEVAFVLHKVVEDRMVEMIPGFVEQVRIMEDLFVRTKSEEAELTGTMFATTVRKLLEIKYGEVDSTHGRRVRSINIRGQKSRART